MERNIVKDDNLRIDLAMFSFDQLDRYEALLNERLLATTGLIEAVKAERESRELTD